MLVARSADGVVSYRSKCLVYGVRLGAQDSAGTATAKKVPTFEAKTPEALVTGELIEYHRRPSAGGVGMTTVAYCAVTPEGRTERAQLWMLQPGLPGLRRLTDTRCVLVEGGWNRAAAA